MPLYFFYTMVQKSQKWPKTQIKGGGPALIFTEGVFIHNNLLWWSEEDPNLRKSAFTNQKNCNSENS